MINLEEEDIFNEENDQFIIDIENLENILLRTYEKETNNDIPIFSENKFELTGNKEKLQKFLKILLIELIKMINFYNGN